MANKAIRKAEKSLENSFIFIPLETDTIRLRVYADAYFASS